MEVREYVNCLLHSSSWYFNWCFLQVPASLVFQMVKKSACNGDPGSIPGSEKSPQEAIDYPLPVFLLGEFHRGAWQATVHGVTKSEMTEQLTLH